MRCPHDGSTLKIRDSEGAIGDLCEACEGMWLTSRAIEALQHHPVRFPSEKFVQLLASGSRGETELPCPGGCGTLTATSMSSLQLDWCRTCRGVWFDGDELKKALRLWSKKNDDGEWFAIDIFEVLISVIDL